MSLSPDVTADCVSIPIFAGRINRVSVTGRSLSGLSVTRAVR